MGGYEVGGCEVGRSFRQILNPKDLNPKDLRPKT